MKKRRLMAVILLTCLLFTACTSSKTLGKITSCLEDNDIIKYDWTVGEDYYDESEFEEYGAEWIHVEHNYTTYYCDEEGNIFLVDIDDTNGDSSKYDDPYYTVTVTSGLSSKREVHRINEYKDIDGDGKSEATHEDREVTIVFAEKDKTCQKVYEVRRKVNTILFWKREYWIVKEVE